MAPVGTTEPPPPRAEGESAAGRDTRPEATLDTPPEEPTAPPPGTWVHAGTVELRVVDFKRTPKGAGNLKPSRGDLTFVSVHAEIRNRGITKLDLIPSRFWLWDRVGTSYAPSDHFADDTLAQEVFLLGLAPKQTETIRLHYEVRKGQDITTFIYSDGAVVLPAAVDDPATRGPRGTLR